jgi:hypothetical protein
MKNLIILLSVLFFLGCTSQEKPLKKDISSIKIEINSLLTNWHKAASDANFDGYFNKMDSVSVFMGTDAKENWAKTQFAAFSKPYFDKGKAWDFKTLERNVSVNPAGNFAWFDELLNTWMGTCRGSGVLEKTNNGWKIKQYVLSIEIPNEDVQAVIDAKKKNDAIFLKEFVKIKI